MVPPISEQVPLAYPYSGSQYVQTMYQYRALTFFGRLSHAVLVNVLPKNWSYNPDHAVTLSVWAAARSLATTYAITIVFSS
jgi:hypothetical protein